MHEPTNRSYMCPPYRDVQLYALTANGNYVAEKLEIALASSGAGKGKGQGPWAAATAAATASPILNRTSYASCSERDGGGGGGTAASRHTGHSPLAPARAHGVAKPGVRLLVDNREKRGATGNSQVRFLVRLFFFLNNVLCKVSAVYTRPACEE